MIRALLVIFAVVASDSTLAQAAFPSRPISMVVGFAPGGGTDITARIIAKKLGENIGQQVLVENRAGAGGNIATDLAARAAPDGHTILLGNVGSLTVAPHMVANLPYNPQRDLEPITLAVTFGNVLVVNPSMPAQTLADYLKLANAKPDTMGFGTSGIGGTGHLAGELLRSMSKASLVHVPYKGGGPAMADLLGGQIPSAFASAASAIPHIKTGKVRALATTSPRRSPFLPSVPTIAESGYPGYEATNWYAYLAPGKTPRDIVARLNRELVKVLGAEDVLAQLAKSGMEAIPSTPEELARHIERELAVWGRVVREAGIKAQ